MGQRACLIFQSTLPARGATGRDMIWYANKDISIHAPREGSDLVGGVFGREQYQFQSTLPARGATIKTYQDLLAVGISIHAPREGSDTGSMPHRDAARGFQSTLPARGATRSSAPAPSGVPDFNPRSPRGERLISTLARRARLSFQSTLPARGATQVVQHGVVLLGISIHAPREGSDPGKAGRHHCGTDFNPRSPRGERPFRLCLFQAPIAFQSTLPARGATTAHFGVLNFSPYFNPRSPRGERRNLICAALIQYNFNPRSPRGERLGNTLVGQSTRMISIHAPREGSDMISAIWAV